MKSVFLTALFAIALSGCGKVDAADPAKPCPPKPGGCTLCELDLTAKTERQGTVCLPTELLQGMKLDRPSQRSINS